MKDDPHQVLFEPIAPVRRKRADSAGQADDNTDLMEYELDQAVREAEANWRRRPERCRVGYAAIKGAFRR